MYSDGWLYVKRDQRGRVKIGYTMRDCTTRSNELTEQGYCLPWERIGGVWRNEHQRYVPDCRAAEARAHRALAD